MGKKLILILVMSMAYAMAINIQNIKYETDFKAKLKSLNSLKIKINNDNLINLEKKEELINSLSSLEQMGMELSPLDEQCLATDMNQIIDDECEEYFDELLPNFKKKLKSTTIDYKLENLSALKSSGDKRAFIKQCVDNILSTDFNLSNYYSETELKIEEEIEDDGYRVDYNLSILRQSKNLMDVWIEGTSDLCLNDIVDKKSLSGSGLRWSGAYLTDYSYKLIDKEESQKNEKNKKWDVWLDQSDLAIECYDHLEKFKASLKGNPNSMNYCKSFDGYLDAKSCDKLTRLTKVCKAVDLKMQTYGEKDDGQSSGARLYVVSKTPAGFKYSINGKPIFSCHADSGAVLDVVYVPTYNDIVNKQSVKYNYSKQYYRLARMSNLAYFGNKIPAYLSCNCAGSLKNGVCMGSVYVSDSELKKGLIGVFSWEKSQGNKQK